MHYLVSTLYVYSILLHAVSDYHVTTRVDPETPAVVIAGTDDFLPFCLSQQASPLRQPASAAASRRVLEPDILEVSHLCGCMF
jgi:hypothetical protein